MADVRGLLIQLAESMGLDDLPFDEHQVASIQFDDLVLNIRADDENGEMILFLKVGDIPQTSADKTDAFAFLLKKNNLFGQIGAGILGIDEQEAAVYLSHRFLADSMPVQQLEKVVESFLNMADSLIVQFKEEVGKSGGGETQPGHPAGMRV